ncbi:MAG: PilT/PilU family type 4a pilus ATPase [Neisseria sicca]|jgi:twitching motility protein|uniref:PilT/PilU family type 4a pilus ATPase n=3 Tax=Neisseriaceae TaxID=481 RepID=A0A0C1GN56_9NEIS|nr:MULTISPECIES: PilT/PilU family type 4a pilus ATPase [Neisseriaceae]MBF1286631.1 PilT/PilU family type 4a pilus ATPase [Neisseria sp.]MBY6283184.1 PilT/PilU family type 4a pilus ATPase [Neisseria flava]OFJ61801.1 type IV pili twitching motility protein PilT [Neisseria sp. HMSC073B07]OFJ79014.1 type IV pili twitching motility protein PilT [Neisseria sp. HMSC072F04]OFM96615.1 type IV pili twitching motility protein PilT [Neisseria sp. HMSC055F11]OFN34671.1 type IV pili twitching motility prot
MMTNPPSAKDELFTWLRHMNKYKGSDLFITTNFPPAMKVDGKITPITDEPLTSEKCMEIAFSIMSTKQIEEFSSTNECNFAISLPDTSRFRVNAMVQRGATALVFRSITSKIPNFDSLNLPPVLKDVVMKKRGLVIFVGGTGSGKSTSLAAMVDHRNENCQDHIITIEDPIEFVHQHKKSIITQREVGVDTENWFAALKNTLRQAPDVILIGEIRDRETMDYALAFAETGHLCLATLHANNSNQALDRIINFFPEERRTQLLTDLSLNLQAFISQRLIPREGGKGRVAAVEILLNSPIISEMIQKGEIHGIKEMMKKSTAMGMQTFDQALYELYERGDISFQDAIKNADSAHDLRLDIQLRSRRAQNAGPDLELI